MKSENFFKWLCKHNLFHDFKENEEKTEICTFCGKKRSYDSTSGWMP